MMEKTGVECNCAEGRPPESLDLMKVASNEAVECGDCGRSWKGLGPETEGV